MRTGPRQRIEKDNHQSIEAKQQRSHSQDGLFAPAAGCFQSELRTHLLKLGFDIPARTIHFNDRLGTEGQVRCEKVFVAVSATFVADEYPPYRHQALSAFVPMPCSGYRFNDSPSTTIPADTQSLLLAFGNHVFGFR